VLYATDRTYTTDKEMSHSFQFRIEPPDAGRRIDEFFALRFGGLSRMRIANLIDAGACLVNGAVAKPGYHVIVGDAVDVSFEVGAPTSMSPEPIPLEVIYEDEHLIVVVKPAGMLVHPTVSVKTGTLANALAYHLNQSRIDDGGWTIEGPGSERLTPGDPQPVIRPGMVHRLDRATSGLIAVAKTPRTLTVLSRHFRKRLVEKRYLALVGGSIDQQTGTISAPIGRDADQRPRWRVTEDGRYAETRFKVLEQMAHATLVELEPVTGRTNQLRIHCAHIGHPIVGDEMYENCESGIENLKLENQAQLAVRTPQYAMRLCLHASSLAFHHPVGGEWMEFTSPLPAEIIRIVDHYRD
jgi:23S rRNA pseudouridine1911/1915/1917 synthase